MNEALDNLYRVTKPPRAQLKRQPYRRPDLAKASQAPATEPTGIVDISKNCFLTRLRPSVHLSHSLVVCIFEFFFGAMSAPCDKVTSQVWKATLFFQISKIRFKNKYFRPKRCRKDDGNSIALRSTKKTKKQILETKKKRNKTKKNDRILLKPS